MTGPNRTGERRVLGYRFFGLDAPRIRRLTQLSAGLLMFALALALMVEARLGVNPWTAFHQGTADKLGVSIGTMVVVTGAVLLVSFGPLREPMGIGTLMNVVVVGPMMDVFLWLIPDTDSMAFRVVGLGVSPVILGLATGLYIGSGLGPGPRDGLMTALARRGVKVSVARAAIEITALGLGWALGGDIGLGTVWFAVTVGWWVRVFLEPLMIDETFIDQGV